MQWRTRLAYASRTSLSRPTACWPRFRKRGTHKMQTFEYASPTSLREVFSLLGSNWGDADILAGGTDQISLMKEYIHTPKRVVSIRLVKDLGGIRQSGNGLRIGANVSVDELMGNQLVRTAYPSLVQAARG